MQPKAKLSKFESNKRRYMHPLVVCFIVTTFTYLSQVSYHIIVYLEVV